MLHWKFGVKVFHVNGGLQKIGLFGTFSGQ